MERAKQYELSDDKCCGTCDITTHSGCCTNRRKSLGRVRTVESRSEMRGTQPEPSKVAQAGSMHKYGDSNVYYVHVGAMHAVIQMRVKYVWVTSALKCALNARGRTGPQTVESRLRPHLNRRKSLRWEHATNMATQMCINCTWVAMREHEKSSR